MHFILKFRRFCFQCTSYFCLTAVFQSAFTVYSHPLPASQVRSHGLWRYVNVYVCMYYIPMHVSLRWTVSRTSVVFPTFSGREPVRVSETGIFMGRNRNSVGATENARHENTGRSKMQDLKMRDMILRHQLARVENARRENAGPNCRGGKCGKS